MDCSLKQSILNLDALFLNASTFTCQCNSYSNLVLYIYICIKRCFKLLVFSRNVFVEVLFCFLFVQDNGKQEINIPYLPFLSICEFRPLAYPLLATVFQADGS